MLKLSLLVAAGVGFAQGLHLPEGRLAARTGASAWTSSVVGPTAPQARHTRKSVGCCLFEGEETAGREDII
jgi:hypothetical protein